MISKNKQYIFYVYAYLREKDSLTANKGSPYYIGKGNGNRAWKKDRKSSSWIPKNPDNIVLLEENLSEMGAFALERRYIKWYGRKNKNNGILINLTDGGEGASGMISPLRGKKRPSRPKEWCDKISKGKFGKNLGKQSKETCIKKSLALKGKHSPLCVTPEINAKRSATLKGRKHSTEHVKKRADARRGKSSSLKGKPWPEARRLSQIKKENNE